MSLSPLSHLLQQDILIVREGTVGLWQAVTSSVLGDLTLAARGNIFPDHGGNILKNSRRYASRGGLHVVRPVRQCGDHMDDRWLWHG